MVRKKSSPGKRLLTDVELELMQSLWDRGEGTVKNVLEGLPPERHLAYTSVATVMKILEKKKFVGSRKDERAHLYYPMVSREDYETKSVRHLVANLFRGAPSSLVMRLVEETEFSSSELEALRELLNERMKP